LASIPRLRKCGAQSVTDGGVTIGIRTDPDGCTHAGYGGVSTCGSTWCCAQCAIVIATRRADELADVMRAVDAAGGCAFMLTLTLRHSTGDRLGWDREQRRRWEALEKCRKARKRAVEGLELNVGRVYEAQHWVGGVPDEDEGDYNPPMGHVCDVEAEEHERAELLVARGCWDAVTDGWEAVTSGGTWVKDQQAHGGMLGWAKVVETTDGSNGWHCHVHALLCFAEDVPLEDAIPIARRMFRRWQRAVEKAGFDASGDFAMDGKIPGWDLRKAKLGDGDLASYFVKLAHEVTSSQAREGCRPGGRTPMQLAMDAAETYDESTVARLWEWQAASQGRKQLTWSGGDRDLRALARLGPEQTDEEIAAEELPADERIGLSPEVWGWTRANDHVTTLMDVAETEGMPGLLRWLDDHGQSYVVGAGVGWVERPDVGPDQPIPRDEGVGLGWTTSTPGVVRPRDGRGRPRRRPSDRPPRWTDDARAALVGREAGHKR
jgi:hypothetical protein